MTDQIARGQRIARVLGSPVAYYTRPVYSSTGVTPFYLVPGGCIARSVFLVAGTYVPSDAAVMRIGYISGGITTYLYNSALPDWIEKTKYVLASPDVTLKENDILFFQMASNPVTPLPELLIGVSLELA